MDNQPGDNPHPTPQPLRTWPAGFLLVGILVLRGLPLLPGDLPSWVSVVAAMGPAGCGALILFWWLTLSRAPGRERALVGVGCVASAVLAVVVGDPSMRGPGTILLAVPLGMGVFALSAILFAGHQHRRFLILGCCACAFAVAALVRNDGMWGDYSASFVFRWKTVAKFATKVDGPARQVESAADSAPDWPGYRGPRRDGILSGLRFATNWSDNPPQALWRREVAPGWSSFASANGYLYTQEQRGDHEAVVCYQAATGEVVWVQSLETRFDEALGGPGPRATPTLAAGGLFTLGANGALLRLSPATGDIVWQQRLQELAKRTPPDWGFSASPLVTGELVIVHAGGTGALGTMAFQIETGELAWSAPAGDHSYGSAHLATLLGQELILMQTNAGLHGYDHQGKVLLDYDWQERGYRVLQPAIVGDDVIIIGNSGAQRVNFSRDQDTISGASVWKSRHLKSDFNDCVIMDGYLYGFNGGTLTCISVETGERAWRGGRYGKGQLLAVTASEALLVLSETGEGVWVRITPDAHEELGRAALLKGKTWNHPLIVGNRLYVRNAREVACFALSVAP